VYDPKRWFKISFLSFFDNKKLNLLAIVVRSTKAKNYAENNNYHIFL